MAGTSSECTYPETWIVYSLAATASVFIFLDTSGIALSFSSMIALPCLFLTGLVTLVRTPRLVGKHGRRGWLPLAVTVLALPVAIAALVVYSRLHFPFHRAHYERVALALKAGQYTLPLKPEDASLGDARIHQEGDDAVAVSFMTVSHGFAGHGGYLRAFGDETALRQGQGHLPGGWKYARSLGDGWYRVGEN